jgi:hypothetical protein
MVAADVPPPKIVLVAPVLGQLQKEFSWPVRRAGPFVVLVFLAFASIFLLARIFFAFWGLPS